MMKKILFSCCFVLLMGTVVAQSLENRLSAGKVAVLFSLNAENYKPKGNLFQNLQSLDFIKKMDERLKKDKPKQYKQLSAIYRNPEEAGINIYPKSYIFMSTLDSNAIMAGWVFMISDAKKFENWVNSSYEEDKESIQKMQVDNANMYIKGDEAMAWNGSCGIITSITTNNNAYRNVNYDDPNYEAKIEEQEKLNKAKKIDLLKKEIAEILKGNVSNPLAENANFKLFAAKPFDAGIWINYEQFNNSINSFLKNIPEMSYGATERFASRLKSFYKDYYDHILFTTNKGNATVTYQTYLSEKIYQLFGNAFNTRINPEFFKYVEGDKLLGMYAVSGDLKALGNGLLELYKNFGEDLTKEGKMIASGVEAMSVLLDEEAILSVMKGDFMIAFTGVKELEVQYTDYQYDGDVYVGPVKKTRKENTVVYVMTMTVGNQENLDKFIKMGVAFGGFKQMNGYYEIAEFGKVQNYFTLDKNILVVSNDVELVKNAANPKLKKSVDAKVQNLTKNNPMTVYVNTQNVVDAILNNTKDIGAEEKKDLLEVKKEVGEFQMVGPNLQGKTFFSEGVLEVNDKKGNSLPTLIRFFNRFVKDRRSNFEQPDSVTEGKKKKKKKKEH